MHVEPFQPLEARLLVGAREDLERGVEAWSRQPVDWDRSDEPAEPVRARQRTLARSVTLKGPGTFFGRHVRTLTLEPFEGGGWWFERHDLPECLPVRASVRNVWTTGDVVSNIVLRAGPPQNYIRMVEHMVALRQGLGIDSLLVRLDSGDPPLFPRGSLNLVEAIEAAGMRDLEQPAVYCTVKEPVVAVGANGAFLALAPPSDGQPGLHIDCAVDFPTAIGRQRIRVPVSQPIFRIGAEARTNTTALRMLYCKTIGRLFADVRNLGYTTDNILIAGRRGYYNEPRLVREGKSLEAVWHRAALDLLAALSLVEDGLFAGRVVSYKAGHALDVRLISQLYKLDLLRVL